MQTHKSFDVAVVGAGVFGVWSAYLLQQSGANVILIDAYGPGNSRASSGGESRIIRMGYGPDEIYSRSALRSKSLWHKFFDRIESSTTDPAQHLYRQTGVLWLARNRDGYCEATMEILQKLGVRVERLSADELQRRYPQFDFAEVAWGILEPDSGAMMARLAVQAVALQAQKDGVTIRLATVPPPLNESKIESITTSTGSKIVADKFVFACGPWLPKVFPAVLADRIHITRQEVFFFGTPAGDDRFSYNRMPIWVDFNDLVYAIPNIDNRGFKLAVDAHGPEFDPDSGERIVTASGLIAARTSLKKRIPTLADMPVIESRVCQYENTSNGDFLIDVHPTLKNVWLVGGGSGHGFKHGPAVGEYVVGLLSGQTQQESRFALASKERVQHRQVY